jgi:hypothetical protein
MRCKIVLLDFGHRLNYEIIKLERFESWVLFPSSGRKRGRGQKIFLHRPGDGGIVHLWNVGLLQRDYAALYPRMLSSSYSPPRDPEISHYNLRISSAYSSVSLQINLEDKETTNNLHEHCFHDRHWKTALQQYQFHSLLQCWTRSTQRPEERINRGSNLVRQVLYQPIQLANFNNSSKTWWKVKSQCQLSKSDKRINSLLMI